MALIYVTGHRNPDADSIAAAIGYAELKRRLDPSDEYVPVRLGDPNAQTEWLIERSEAPLPELLPHVLLRVRDVMREEFPTARDDEPVREVGLTMAREGLDLVPIVDSEGALVGVMTERALARRYIRESREASRLDAPTSVAAIVGVLEGELEAGDEQREISGRVWVLAMDVRSPTKVEEGDVVVSGDRPDVQRRALERGAAVLVTSNGTPAGDDVLELAREHEAAVITSTLDSYVTARMITLAAPCHALMDAEPLTVRRDDLISDISENVKDVHYRAAVAVSRPAARSDWSRARTSWTPSRGACCWWTTPRARRACPGWRRPRSWRSSTTTTSARSRRACRWLPPSTPWAPRPRSWSSASAKRAWSPRRPPPRCCWARCCRTP